MNKKVFLILIILFFWFSGYALANRSACVVCHSALTAGKDKAVMGNWSRSVHKANGVTCDTCHGGNPNIEIKNAKRLSPGEFKVKKMLAMSKADGFVPAPSGRQMFNLCGQCHTDAVERYEGSIMGEAYLNGKGGPSCTTCHSAHNVVIPDVPKVCEQCHKNTTGFDQIDPMAVNRTTIMKLSKIKIKLAEEKIKGRELPLFPEELKSFQIGFVAFGAVIILFIVAYIIYIVIEKEKRR